MISIEDRPLGKFELWEILRELELRCGDGKVELVPAWARAEILAIAAEAGIGVDVLLCPGSRRLTELARFQRCAITLLRETTTVSLAAIGKLFGIEHRQQVREAIAATERNIKNNGWEREFLQKVIRRLSDESALTPRRTAPHASVHDPAPPAEESGK